MIAFCSIQYYCELYTLRSESSKMANNFENHKTKQHLCDYFVFDYEHDFHRYLKVDLFFQTLLTR